MNNALIKKFRIKPDQLLLVLNGPKEFSTNSKTDLKPNGKTKYDFVLLFVKDKSELDKLIIKAINALKEGGSLWVAYPKKSSSIKTDISRDHGWNSLNEAGFEGVSLIAVDDTWSAMRCKPHSKIAATKKVVKSSSRKSFTAVMEKPDHGMDTAYVSIPYNVEEVHESKGHIKVKAWFDGHPYRGILANMGTGCHVILIRKDIRSAIGKSVGDTVDVEIEQDTEDRIVDVPKDLKQAFSRSPKAANFFNSLSYTNRKEYAGWISSAKKNETREKRISETIQKLLKGLKNPTQK